MLRHALRSACAVAVLACTAVTAGAQTYDYRTYFTFSQPVELPGVTLPAGKYLFRLADPNGSRNVVQVLSADGKKAYATLLAIPEQRFDVPSHPEVRFIETAAGTPPAIKSWWYSGNTIGWEFIYPKEQALRLAKAASQPVPTEKPIATSEGIKPADASRVPSTGSKTHVTAQPTPVR